MFLRFKPAGGEDEDRGRRSTRRGKWEVRLVRKSKICLRKGVRSERKKGEKEKGEKHWVNMSVFRNFGNFIYYVFYVPSY